MTPYFRGTTVLASRKLAHASFGKSALALLWVSASMLAGCSHLQKPPRLRSTIPRSRRASGRSAGAGRVVELPKPLPLPGQLKPLPGGKPTPRRRTRGARQPGQCRRRVQPVRNGFINAVQIYPFSGGALYQAYTAPGQITDVALQAGEQLTGSGPVAAGDTCAGSSATPRAEPAPPKRSTS